MGFKPDYNFTHNPENSSFFAVIFTRHLPVNRRDPAQMPASCLPTGKLTIKDL